MPNSLSSPNPAEVPDYEGAKAAGLLPQVPSTPPKPLPGTSAYIEHILILPTWGLGIVLLTVMDHVIPKIVGLTALVFLFVSLLILGITIRQLLEGRHRVYQELAAGYTTITFTYTLIGNNGRGARANGDRIGWNFAGIWIMKPNGEVRQSPDFNALPPGFYPSPSKVDAYELWTGSSWARVYDDRIRS